MTNGRGRTWAWRVGAAILILAVAAGAYAGWNWSGLSARHADYRLRTAGSDDERAAAAARLVALGDAGAPFLVGTLRGDDPECCRAVAAAVLDRLAADPGSPCARPLLDGLTTFSEPGKVAALEFVPALLKSPYPDAAARCRDAVRVGLAAATPDGKVRAVRLALRPEIGVKADVVPLLNDPDADVRRAAMLAVGPADESVATVIDDESLFRWLHDPDDDVRDLCRSALRTRGLDAEQVLLARQLTHPDPAERLRLLLDLHGAGDVIRDPGPWLERLSRDSDPAVRLGAARVGCECRLTFTGWMDRLADRDTDPTVRHWASYYRKQAATVRQTGFSP
jgi:hypothetical protein